jgi:hypothetical protein
VPFLPGRDISPTLLREIARGIGTTVEEFLQREQNGLADDEAVPLGFYLRRIRGDLRLRGHAARSAV